MEPDILDMKQTLGIMKSLYFTQEETEAGAYVIFLNQAERGRARTITRAP